MKKLLNVFSIVFFAFSLLAQTTEHNASLDALVAKMSLEHKAALVVGKGMRFPGAPPPSGPVVGKSEERVPGAAGSTFSIPELNIPGLVVADGPAGLRISPIRKGDSTNTYYATAFPIATMLASTWDTTLVKKVGIAIGNEVLEYGVDIILMPALNLHRNPLCGRNFEYYSEDPLITGSATAAMVNGIQSQGVGTSIKHFAANNQETNRNNINTIVSERALREIYLKGYEIAVKRSAPWTVMSSYNKINGVYTSESYDLLTTILRDDWGFQGFVMTDWGGGKDPVAQMQAGNDLLMPGRPQQSQAIIDAVKTGTLDSTILETNVKRIIHVVQQSPSFRKYTYSNKPDLKAHAQIARSVAAEGMILLKNEKDVLPIATNKKIVLFGNGSFEIVIGGTGSGDVNEAYSVSLDQGMRNAGYRLDDSLTHSYAAYIKQTRAEQPKPRFFRSPPPIPQMALPAEVITAAAQETDLAVITISRISGEFTDRKLVDDYYLADAEKEMIQNISQAFHALKKNVVVVLNIGGVIEVASWRDQVDAILLAWQPGQEGGNAIADVLSGRVNPSGKLVDTFPMDYPDVPSAKNFPGAPADKPDSVVYEEGIFVGYRYYNTFNVKPAYEFGYGLSYTTFSYGKVKLSSSKFKESITTAVKITNTGKVAGREVVQLYLSAPAKQLFKPESELKAFAKTKLLQPGDSETLAFTLTAQDLTSFDTQRCAWLAEQGDYTIKIGASASDIKQTATFRLADNLVVEQLNRALSPQMAITELRK